MITHIQGKLVEKNPTDVVIDCNGVGYMLNISLHTYSQIPNQEHLKLYTHLQIKEDSHTLYGELYRWPAATWPKGAMLDIIEWDTHKPLGQIPQVEQTYSVVGNMNEH